MARMAWFKKERKPRTTERVRLEIEQFFQTVVAFEGKDLRLLGFEGKDEADRVLRAAVVD